jgi:hypothetical protein
MYRSGTNSRHNTLQKNKTAYLVHLIIDGKLLGILNAAPFGQFSGRYRLGNNWFG